jgi:hypothetical protein
MRKLRLDTDDVRVESFVTVAAAGVRGTVHAKSDSMLYCRTFEETCWNMGCKTGITNPEQCPADETGNGQPGCPGTSQAPGYTCDNTCSDYGCTLCNAWC